MHHSIRINAIDTNDQSINSQTEELTLYIPHIHASLVLHAWDKSLLFRFFFPLATSIVINDGIDVDLNIRI